MVKTIKVEFNELKLGNSILEIPLIILFCIKGVVLKDFQFTEGTVGKMHVHTLMISEPFLIYDVN